MRRLMLLLPAFAIATTTACDPTCLVRDCGSISEEEARVLATTYGRALVYPSDFVAYVGRSIDDRDREMIADAAPRLAKQFRGDADDLPSQNEYAESITGIGNSAGVPPDIIGRTINEKEDERQNLLQTAFFLEELDAAVDALVTDGESTTWLSSDLYATASAVESLTDLFLDPSLGFSVTEFRQFLFDVTVWSIMASAGYLS